MARGDKYRPPEYTDGSQQHVLFSTRGLKPKATKGRNQKPAVVPAAWALCPSHRGNGDWTGLVYQQTGTSKLMHSHLVYRLHYYTNWSGTEMLCRASGVSICVAPPVSGKMRIKLTPDQSHRENGERPAQCPHDGGRP